MKKRILIFSLAYYPHEVSGAEAAIREITDRMSPEHIEFHLVTLRFEKILPVKEVIGNITVHRVGHGSGYLSKILYIPYAIVCARQLHRRHHFSGMWAMMTYMLFPVVLLKVFGVRIPYMLTLQDGDPYEKVFARWYIRPLTPLLNSGFRGARVVQVISTFLASWPRERGYRGAVIRIPNGPDPRDVDQSIQKNEIDRMRQSLRMQQGEIVLINTARLELQKGNDVTIRALTLLPSNIKLVLVGSGSERHTLEVLARDLRVEERVLFIPRVSRDEVSVYRKAADIFCAPSRSEGLGIAQLSALAAGLPLISTTVGGLADFVRRDDTAWVIPTDDPQALSMQVLRILENPDEVLRIRHHAHHMIHHEYSWDRIAKDMDEKCFSLL
jgi:glycosyltransferase involved in cell wall biosynthesis